ncbi:hypothetical protein ACLOJK_005642 [Asimina triloba]
MTRRCSHCSHNGHNSRTCPNRGVKLFGVRLTDGSIRKSASMGNLTHYAGSGTSGGNNPGSPAENHESGAAADGYASEDFVPGSSCRERKKVIFMDFCIEELGHELGIISGGNLVALLVISVKRCVPWTEEEHRMFLLGLQKLGKGDWRGISRNFVVSRTPTQVASHAQKYFIRQTNVTRRRRRSSLFDMTADESVETPVVERELFPVSHQQSETQSNVPLPLAPPLEEECESMDSSNSNNGEAVAPNPEISPCGYPVMFPAYFSPFLPFSFPFWPGYTAEPLDKETHEVVKPTAIHSKNPINVDELVGMSKLTLGESLGQPSSLSQKLLEGSARQSAFHANPAANGSSMNSGSNPIHAV